MASEKIRGSVNDTVKMSLLCDAQGKCPLCRTQLIKKKSGKNTRVFDVAHIYPLNPKPAETKLLEHEERLALDDDTEDNFIALCKICHKEYDTNKTLIEYRKLVAIKKEMLNLRALQLTWDKQTLHEDIEKVASKISSLNSINIKKTKLSYSALKVEEKKDDTFGIAYEVKVTGLIINFYNPIKNAFEILDQQERYKSDFIYSQVNSYYNLLLLKGFDQNKIFDIMCEWFMSTTAIRDRIKAEVLVSFFIQNCEVFTKC